jgi:hypothetical protein
MDKDQQVPNLGIGVGLSMGVKMPKHIPSSYGCPKCDRNKEESMPDCMVQCGCGQVYFHKSSLEKKAIDISHGNKKPKRNSGVSNKKRR